MYRSFQGLNSDTHSSTGEHKHRYPPRSFPTCASSLQDVVVVVEAAVLMVVVLRRDGEGNDAGQQRMLSWRPPSPESPAGVAESRSYQEVSAETRDEPKEPG